MLNAANDEVQKVMGFNGQPSWCVACRENIRPMEGVTFYQFDLDRHLTVHHGGCDKPRKQAAGGFVMALLAGFILGVFL
jgi:hypothetical protein